MDRTKALVVGILIGGLVMVNLPVQAHHSTSVRRLQSQLSSLQSRVTSLESGQTSLNSRINTQQASINTLVNKTKLNDAGGFYNGPILKDQVFSTVCDHGDDAVWAQDPDIAEIRSLSCSVGPYAPIPENRTLVEEHFSP